jgi:ferredoxin-NADP reductase
VTFITYPIASAPEASDLVLTVERLEDGEVSPYLFDVQGTSADLLIAMGTRPA